MQKRSPIAVVLLTIVTFGIYALVWHVKTKREMNARGADIPPSWLLLVPLVNFYWLWKWAEGVEVVTRRAMSSAAAFVLIVLTGFIGQGIVQAKLNQAA
jgi:hypothetical protein